MKEYDVFRCPLCGRYDTEEVDENYWRCRLCGVTWDRIYQDGKGLHIHK